MTKKLDILKKIVWLVFLCGLPFRSIAQTSYTPAKAKEDLDYLKIRLEKYHPGLYRYNDSLQYAGRYEQIRKSLDKEIAYQDFFNAMAPMITDIRDLHTSFDMPKKKYGKNPKIFPLILRRFDKRFFVHFNASSDTTILRTAELLKVNNENIYEVYLRLQTLYGTDNGNISNKEYYAERAFAGYYLRYYGHSDSVAITYRLPGSDSVFKKNIGMETNRTLLKNISRRYKNGLRKNFDFVMLDSVRRVAKLDITSFTLKGKYFDFTQRKFKRELRRRFEAIESNGIDHLILDLRGNGGGFIPNITRLMKYISPEPFLLVDSLIFKKQAFNKLFPWYTVVPPVVASFLFRAFDDEHYVRVNKASKKKQPHTRNHYDGKLYFLMDGGSYSATTFTLGLAYDMNLGTFIGTRPGGANWGSYAGEWYDFKLPNSKIRVHLPLYKIVHKQPYQRNSGFFIEPDFYVGQNFQDFRRREDTPVKFTLNMIRASEN